MCSDSLAELRHRVISRASPGMTAAYTLYGKPCASKRTMLGDGIDGILAACGLIAACCGKMGRNRSLIKADK